MPKFNDPTRLYGDSDYPYGVDGSSPPNGSIQWIFLVDWDNNLTYSYNEAGYVSNISLERGQRYYIKGDGSGFEQIAPGTATVTLENKDLRFDPDNTGSPLTTKILPGRRFKLMVKDLATDTLYPIMAGYIDDIPPLSDDNKVEFRLKESWNLLDKTVSLAIIYRKSIDSIMNSLVTAGGWPTSYGKAMDSESQYITAFSVDKLNALQTLTELADACMGEVFADRTGKLIFYSRAHTTMPTHTLDQAQCLKAIRKSQPWENVRNDVEVIANRKVKKREEALWQNSGPIELTAGDARLYSVQYPEAIDVRVYSFVTNTQADGLGQSAASSVIYDVDVYPRSMNIEIENTSGSTVYVTEMIIVGRPIVDQPVGLKASDATSQGKFGVRPMTLDNPWMQSINHARGYSSAIVAHLKDPKRTIEVQIEQRPDYQFAYDLLDKVTFTSAKLGINEELYVGQIRHEWQRATGQSVVTTLVLRPRLNYATAVSNDPEDPDLPYIPDPVLPIDWPIVDPYLPPDEPPPDETTCLTDMSAPANGPFALSGNFPIELRSNGNYNFDTGIAGNMYLRSSGATNKSFLTVLGDWQIWDTTTDQWNNEVNADNWHIMLNGSIEGSKRAITDGGSGTRTIDMSLGGAVAISSIRLSLDPTGSEYRAGSVISSGTLQAYNPTPVAVPVTPGSWYAVEGAGGPWYSGLGYEYTINLDANLSMANVAWIGRDHNGTHAQAGFGDYAEMISANYGRVYFKATGNAVYIIVADTYFGDNTGTMGWVLRAASYDEIHRWIIRGISLYNVCSGTA